MSYVLEVEHIRKAYAGHLAVEDVSFAVRPGRIFGLLGPNGAGKTTSIRMIMDIIAPDSGSIRIFGNPRDEETNARIGYLPEERGLYRKMTVFDQLLFLAEIRGLRKRDAVPRIEKWLDEVELREWRDHKVEELSKGMQQKIQYVGTVVHDPALLILDEPFSGLDPINTIMLKDFMIRAREEGKAIIFSTHVLEQAEKLCDDLCLVKGGNVILDGNIESVRDQFRKPEFRLTGDRLDGLRDLPEIKSLDINGGAAHVELHAFDQHDSFLEGALKVTSLREFTTVEPELEQIFIEAVQRADR